VQSNAAPFSEPCDNSTAARWSRSGKLVHETLRRAAFSGAKTPLVTEATVLRFQFVARWREKYCPLALRPTPYDRKKEGTIQREDKAQKMNGPMNFSTGIPMHFIVADPEKLDLVKHLNLL
jgi:hypothetical protein